MKTDIKVKDALLQNGWGWFGRPGAYVLVDGQFGSTGKGLLASVLAESAEHRISVVTSNAGPNSGHTAYSPVDGSKIVTQQIPVGAVVLAQMKFSPITYLNAGAVLDLDILAQECRDHQMLTVNDLLVNPMAAVIEETDRLAEARGGPAKIASTGKGVGSAMARKIMREGNVFGAHWSSVRQCLGVLDWNWTTDVVFVETAQGFSLGLNSRFYPHVTARECTVMQALADARIPWNKVRRVASTFRTYPIRVGNTNQGNSGAVYEDQSETSWDAIGVEPELTTVTKRVRRVFTWSRQQFRESVRTNQPDTILLSFCDYIPTKVASMVDMIRSDYLSAVQKDLDILLLSFGPKNSDVVVAP